MSHYKITEETYYLKHNQIIELMHQIIESLLWRIDELQVSDELMEDLILFEEDGKIELSLLSSSKDCALFKEITSRCKFMKSNEPSFSSEQ